MSEAPSPKKFGIPPKLTNPLSAETRKERLYLLGMSAIGITIVFTGLIPTEISTLGIAFAEADRTSLLLIFALVVAYFLAAFVSYALSDFLEWFAARHDLMVMRIHAKVDDEKRYDAIIGPSGSQERREEIDQEEVEEVEKVEENPYYEYYAHDLADLEEIEREWAKRYGSRSPIGSAIIYLRFAFDFIVPPIVGTFAIASLLIRAF
jgi:hypothetical protein